MIKTSEAVSIGHPDALCDQIADSIFDYLRNEKDNPQSAVEVAASANTLFIFGEIDADIVYNGTNDTNTRNVEKANPGLAHEIKQVALKCIRDIGYDEQYYNPDIVFDVSTQSIEINQAVEKEDNAGDQGIVNGYAVAETHNYQSQKFSKETP